MRCGLTIGHEKGRRKAGMKPEACENSLVQKQLSGPVRISRYASGLKAGTAMEPGGGARQAA
jgi:hypothetical protein